MRIRIVSDTNVSFITHIYNADTGEEIGHVIGAAVEITPKGATATLTFKDVEVDIIAKLQETAVQTKEE
jgi:hypothetical protein